MQCVRARLSLHLVACGVLVLGAAASSATAETSRLWSEEQLARSAVLIVIGHTTAVEVGRDPVTTWIYTYVTVEVSEVLKGPVDLDVLVVKQAGGVIGAEGLTVSGQAQFAPGEDVLLFLDVRPRDGTLYPSAFWQGKWTVGVDTATGARAVMRSDGRRRSLASVRDVIQSLVVADIPASPRFVTSPSDTRTFAAYTLPPTRYRWREAHVPVDIANGEQPGLGGGGLAEIQLARREWNSGAAGAITLDDGVRRPFRCIRENQGDGRIVITFDDPCHEVSNLGLETVSAWTFWRTDDFETINGVVFNRVVQATITTNDTENSRQFNAYSGCFMSGMIHAFGHVLGFADDTHGDSVMYPSIPNSCQTTPLALSSEDLDGLRLVYPIQTPPPPTVPGTPGNVAATVGPSVLAVTWTAPSTGATPTAYRLDFFSGSTPVLSLPVAAVTSASVAIPAGVVGTFGVQVTALAEGLAGAPSNLVLFTIGVAGCTAPPPAPSGLSGTITAGTAVVSWTASIGATSYIVQAGSTTGMADLFNANVGSTTAVSASGLPAGFRAFVRVAAVNACGASLPTADVLVQ